MTRRILLKDMNKKIAELSDGGLHIFLLHSNIDLLFFSNMMGHSIRLQKISKSAKNWQFYRSSIFGLVDSIYVSSGTCEQF